MSDFKTIENLSEPRLDCLDVDFHDRNDNNRKIFPWLHDYILDILSSRKGLISKNQDDTGIFHDVEYYAFRNPFNRRILR